MNKKSHHQFWIFQEYQIKSKEKSISSCGKCGPQCPWMSGRGHSPRHTVLIRKPCKTVQNKMCTVCIVRAQWMLGTQRCSVQNVQKEQSCARCSAVCRVCWQTLPNHCQSQTRFTGWPALMLLPLLVRTKVKMLRREPILCVLDISST